MSENWHKRHALLLANPIALMIWKPSLVCDQEHGANADLEISTLDRPHFGPYSKEEASNDDKYRTDEYPSSDGCRTGGCLGWNDKCRNP
jgi:hypothetical protein